MEARAAELESRLGTVSSFGELVNAMQGVAAARAQHARQVLAGTQAYARTVADAMAQALALLPERDAEPEPAGLGKAPGRRSLWLLFAAEQSFNGGFSDRVLAALPAAPSGNPTGQRVMLLGSQGQRLAAARGMHPEWSGPLIAHADGVVAASEVLQTALAQALAREPAASVELIHAVVLGEAQGSNHFEIRHQRLLPLDRATLRRVGGSHPLVHLPPQQLFDELAQEYVSAQLIAALLNSHAAENLSRLQAMAAARDNVSRMVEQLESDGRLLRQEAITAEIVELAAGLRALRDRESGGG